MPGTLLNDGMEITDRPNGRIIDEDHDAAKCCNVMSAGGEWLTPVKTEQQARLHVRGNQSYTPPQSQRRRTWAALQRHLRQQQQEHKA